MGKLTGKAKTDFLKKMSGGSKPATGKPAVKPAMKAAAKPTNKC